jgi:hypothetical protein
VRGSFHLKRGQMVELVLDEYPPISDRRDLIPRNAACSPDAAASIEARSRKPSFSDLKGLRRLKLHGTGDCDVSRMPYASPTKN